MCARLPVGYAERGTVPELLPYRVPALRGPGWEQRTRRWPGKRFSSHFRCHTERQRLLCKWCLQSRVLCLFADCLFFLGWVRPLLCDGELLPNNKYDSQPWDVVLVPK